MVNSVSASEASSGAVAVPAAQPVAAAPAIAKPSTTGEDTVRISATARQVADEIEIAAIVGLSEALQSMDALAGCRRNHDDISSCSASVDVVFYVGR